jgi:hypothetical protein
MTAIFSTFWQLPTNFTNGFSTVSSRIQANRAHFHLSPPITGPMRVVLKVSEILGSGKQTRQSTGFVVRSFGAPVKHGSTEGALRGRHLMSVARANPRVCVLEISPRSGKSALCRCQQVMASSRPQLTVPCVPERHFYVVFGQIRCYDKDPKVR